MNKSLTLKENKTQIILNSGIELGELEGNGKGRYFMSRFIEAGIAHYKELGDILITKETLNKFIHTMVGCPVIIEHEDVTDKNVDKLRVGVISKVWYNEFDGWFYCEGILTDPEAIDLVKNQGYSVSCAYSFVSDNTKKTHNGKEIDMEFIDGEFLHLAIVNDPRYEGANIVVNKNDDDLEWITVKGNHIPVKKGQSKDDAVKEFLEGKQSDTKDKSGGSKKDEPKGEAKDKHGFKKDKDSGYYMKDLPDGTSVYVEKKEGGQGEKEPFFLEATHFDENGKVLDKKQYHYDSMDGMFSKIDKDFSSKDKSGDSGEKGEEIKIDKEYLENIKYKGIKTTGQVKELAKEVNENTPKDFNIYTVDGSTAQEYTKTGDDEWVMTHLDATTEKIYWQKKVKTFDVVTDMEDAKRISLLPSKYKDKANNSIGDITMTVLNDLTDFIKKVVKNEKDEEMTKEVKNEDKRKLIDEVGGILKGKVDEEVWRTVVGKLEKVAYEPSEDDKADNEDDKEKEAKNKCKNEEDEKEEKVTENEEEKKEDKKEEADNEDEDKKEDKKEVKNSMKDIVMGGNGQAQEQKLYTSRKERLEEGNKY